jgi:uncharacterized protein
MQAISFTTEDGVRLGGELRVDTEPPRARAVVCHPHPKHGGSKDHPILWALRNQLASVHGFAALLFNFRGVMGSSGVYGGGRDEVEDVRGAITFIEQAVAAAPLLLVGWSFGASVALRESLLDERVGALALIGIPLVPGDLELPVLPEAAEVRTAERPTIFVAGERDVYCPPDLLRDYASESGADVSIVEGTDHFFWRRERELASMIGDWTERILELG